MKNQSICPTGFVIPDFPENRGIVYVDRTITECAFSCFAYPRYTPEEHAMVVAVRKYSLFIPCCLVSIALFLWCRYDTKNLSKNFFVILYAVNLVLGGIVLSFVITAERNRYCEDDATPVYSHPTPVCTTEGFFSVFCFGVCCVCWSVESYVLYDRIVLGTRAHEAKTFEYLPFIVGLPLWSSLLLVWNNSFVYELGRTDCLLWGKNVELEAIFGWGYNAVAIILGLYFVIAIAVKIVLLYNSKTNNAWEVVRLFSTTIKYMFAFGVYFGFLFVQGVVMGLGALDDSSSTGFEMDREWALCVFQHYDGVSDDSFLPQCGRTPERQFSIEIRCFRQFFAYGMPGLLFLMVYWKQLYEICLRQFFPHRVHPRPLLPRVEYVVRDPNETSSC
jgi:hypothetical protein